MNWNVKLRAVSSNRHTSGEWTETWSWELFPALFTSREHKLYLNEVESCFQQSPQVRRMNWNVKLRAVSSNRHTSGVRTALTWSWEVFRTRHTSEVWTALTWSWELFPELATCLEYELHLREVESCFQNSPHVWSMNCTYVKLRSVSRTRHTSRVWTALTWSWELFPELATRREYELHLREVEGCFQHSPQAGSINCT
jgi:hypothetical protein